MKIYGDALGVDSPTSKSLTRAWRDEFLNLIRSGGPAQALGAIGLGTESILDQIYRPFIQATTRKPALTPDRYAYLLVQVVSSPRRKNVLRDISAHYLSTEHQRISMRRGMLSALRLRVLFWARMHDRALEMDSPSRSAGFPILESSPRLRPF